MAAPTDFTVANSMMLDAYAALSAASSTEEELETLSKLNSILSTPIMPEKVSHFFEFGYARRADLPSELLPVFADIGNYATAWGFYGLSVDNRGALMELVLRGSTLPEGATEPDSSPLFAAPATPPI